MLRRGRRSGDRHTPDAPEVTLSQIVGTPMSHESVLLLARLQSIADQLERAVYRLERQTDAAEEAEERESHNEGGSDA